MSEFGSEWFWEQIAKAQGDENRMKSHLEGMTREEIIRLYRELNELSAEIRLVPSVVRSGNLSEDSLADLAEYIISQGQATYQAMLDNPDIDLPLVPKNAPSFKGLALTEFWNRYRESIPDEA